MLTPLKAIHPFVKQWRKDLHQKQKNPRIPEDCDFWNLRPADKVPKNGEMNLFAFVLLVAISSSPTPRNGSKQEQSAQDYQSGADKPAPSAISPLVSSPIENQPTKNKVAKTKKETNCVWQKAFAPENWANLILACVGIAGIIVANRTLNTIKEQVAVEKAATQAAQTSADVSNKSLLLLERARLQVEKFLFVVSDDGKRFTWTFTLVNTGHTPADIIEQNCGFKFHVGELPDEFPPLVDKRRVPGVLTVGAGQRLDFEGDFWIAMKNEPLYGLGYFKYEGIFEGVAPHETTYGFLHRPGQRPVTVRNPGYNSAT